MKNYQKPSLKLVSLRNQETVADTCWGYHNNTDVVMEEPWYMDVEGQGYLQFKVYTSKNCSISLTDVYYYEGRNDKNPDHVTATNEFKEMYAHFEEHLKTSGGNGGQPFHKDANFQEKPDPSWS